MSRLNNKVFECDVCKEIFEISSSKNLPKNGESNIPTKKVIPYKHIVCEFCDEHCDAIFEIGTNFILVVEYSVIMNRAEI